MNKDLISRDALLVAIDSYGKEPMPDMRTSKDYELAISNMFARFRNEVTNAERVRPYTVTCIATGKVLSDTEIIFEINKHDMGVKGDFVPYSLDDLQQSYRRTRMFMFDWLPRDKFEIINEDF